MPWAGRHDDRPEIGDAAGSRIWSRIAAMNPAADKAQAVENSYTMKVNKRKLENAKSDDTKETLEKTIREDTQTIGCFRNRQLPECAGSEGFHGPEGRHRLSCRKRPCRQRNASISLA